MVAADVTTLIGRTPLVRLARLDAGLPGRVLAKLEMQNPGGSVKDRLGVALIEDAERRGELRPGMTIIEPTGGNTGIGLAVAAAVRGYPLILTMPSSMSTERVALLRHLGADVVLTPGILMQEAMDLAAAMTAADPNAVMLDQFRNPANPAMHEATTGVEIWEGTGGHVDVFVSAVGTGGTITGVGRRLRRHNPTVRLVAVEPAGAAVLSGGPAGDHSMPGIGVGFVPEVLARELLDEVIVVTDEEAFGTARALAKKEGVLAGVSSGAALHAALQIAARESSHDQNIVVLLADGAERYLSSALFAY